MSEARVQRFQEFAHSNEAPASYRSNSTAEGETLTAIDTFTDVYHKYYPDRKPLLLSAFNECNQKKPVCTFVRPTALQYDRLYDLENCCQFVAGYIAYEPFHDPSLYPEMHDFVEQFPEQIASPTTALEWQAGNSLEMSLVLVSFLRGIGYNAFVVTGYARPSVCLNDLRSREWDSDIPIEVNSDDEEAPMEGIHPDYLALMSRRPHLRRVSDPDPWKPEEDSDSPVAASTGKASSHKHGSGTEMRAYEVRAAHSWVLVLPGGRKDLKQAVFAEASTGELISIAEADKFYIGIESIFSDKNYHVNLRNSVPPGSMSFDLKDHAQWETLFTGGQDSDEKESMGATLTATSRRGLGDPMTSSVAGGTFGGTNTSSIAGLPPAKTVVSVPRSWVSELILTPAQYASRYPGGVKVLTYANAKIRLFAEYSQPDMRVKEVRIPDSDFPDLDQVHIFYAHRADKLRRRTLFPHLSLLDGGRPAEDSGMLRSQTGGTSTIDDVGRAPTTYRLLWEWYEIGRMRNAAVEGLREFIHEPGKVRTMRFYWRAREDGLARRDEYFYDERSLRKVKEAYHGRVDRMYCRSAVFDRPKTVRETNAHNIITNPETASEMKDLPRLEPIRMSQKFERCSTIPADKDIAKTKFIRPNGTDESGEMWVYFHYGEESIIRPYHMFSKGSSKVEDYIASSVSQKPQEPPMKIVTVPGQTPPSDLELFNERKWLKGVETDCLAGVRGQMDDQLTTLFGMERDHAVVQAVLSTYDTLRNRPSETEAERAQKLAESMRREESRKDYLAPYIAKLEMPDEFDGNYLQARLTAEQAKQVRDEALTELKERLIRRGHIMQNRMDREKEDFNKRQLQYQKNADTAAVDGGREAEDFARYCKEATWRMKVLDERLSKHIDNASERYAQLAQRLSEDPRLAALYNS